MSITQFFSDEPVFGWVFTIAYIVLWVVFLILIVRFVKNKK